MKIVPIIPHYGLLGHLPDNGGAYNYVMELLPSDDAWACLLDHDVLFLTRDWYTIMEEVIELRPDISVWSCMTNRVGNPLQLFGWNGSRYANGHPVISDNHDIRKHREIAYHLSRECRHEVIELDGEKEQMSGMLMLLQKKTWNAVGGFRNGTYGIDTMLHWAARAAGFKVGIMGGLYVYHYYRDDCATPIEDGHLR